MEWTPVLVFTSEVMPLPHDAAESWCNKHLVRRDVVCVDSFVAAMCHSFGVTEEELRLAVQEQFLNTKSFTWETIER